MLYFNELNAVGMTLYFMIKNNKSKIEHLRLMKLLYLAERKSLDKHGTLLSFDTPISMQNGPALDNIRNIINGRKQDAPIWDNVLSRKNGDYISMTKDGLSLTDLNFIGKSKIDILNEVWEEHGTKPTSELVNFTHDSCKEWSYNHGEKDIEIHDILLALNKTESEIDSVLRHLVDVEPITALSQ